METMNIPENHDQGAPGMLLEDWQQEHLKQILSGYKGNGEVLQNALGAVLVGRMYGYRVLRVVLGTATYAKYQRVLDLRFKDWCPPETDLSGRHRGYKLALAVGDFWQVVTGHTKRPEGFAKARKEFVD